MHIPTQRLSDRSVSCFKFESLAKRMKLIISVRVCVRVGNYKTIGVRLTQEQRASGASDKWQCVAAIDWQQWRQPQCQCQRSKNQFLFAAFTTYAPSPSVLALTVLASQPKKRCWCCSFVGMSFEHFFRCSECLTRFLVVGFFIFCFAFVAMSLTLHDFIALHFMTACNCKITNSYRVYL